jgi:cytochrome P450
MQLTPDMAPPPRRIADLPGPKGRPLFGNVRDIRARPFHQVMEGWAREHGPLYRFTIMRRQMLATADRDLIATLLRDRPDLIRRSTRSAEMLDEVGTRGLFTAEGEDWRRQRKLVMRALTPEVIHNFFPTLAAMTERLRLRWEACDCRRPPGGPAARPEGLHAGRDHRPGDGAGHQHAGTGRTSAAARY